MTGNKFILLCGPPGSGKSTKASELRRENPGAVYLSTDEYIERFARLYRKTYNEVFQHCIGRAGKRLDRLVKLAKKKKLDVIWDQTNLTEKIRCNRKGKFEDYRGILYYTPQLPLSILLERNKNRSRGPLDEKIIRNMHTGYQLPDTLEVLNFWEEDYEISTLTPGDK